MAHKAEQQLYDDTFTEWVARADEANNTVATEGSPVVSETGPTRCNKTLITF